jgi:DtxR family Mn-dependent transcriptional regulator
MSRPKADPIPNDDTAAIHSASGELTATGELSPTVRDYLAEIYRLSQRQNDTSGKQAYVSTSALADRLDVSPPAVNRMVTKLRDMGLLEHEPYQGILLTDAGAREALKQLRRHRIVEAFLVNVMGFGWHEIHEEANKISGALTDAIEQRMLDMAGNPQFCPHGEPIPSANGDVIELNDVLLSQVAEKQQVTITRVRTREEDRLEYLAALGLTPGTSLEVLHVAPFNGPLQLKVGKEYRIIGHNLAEMIRVVPT